MQAVMGLPPSPTVLAGAAEGLVRANLALMQQRHGAPKLYGGRVRYRREPAGQERWDTWPEVLARGYGDCEDLAAWRAAELRYTGADPGASVAVIRTGPSTMHAVVRRTGGRIEDPSKRLGMGAHELGAAPMTRTSGPVTWRVSRAPGGYLLRVDAPMMPPIYAMAKAPPPAPKSAPAPVKRAVKRKRKGVKAKTIKKGVKLAAGIASAFGVPGAGALAAFL